MNIFSVNHRDKNSSARTGVLKTVHGVIQTPAFIPVGTQATVKSLTPEEVKNVGAQVILANTYHLYLQPGAERVQKLGGLHKFMNWDKPIFTDSGGFQVFSLGSGKKKLRQGIHGGKGGPTLEQGEVETLCEINENGVTFKSHLDGTLHEFTPEKSIDIQQKLGADCIIAFDECTPYPASPEYAKKALDRTHRWAKRCIEYKNKSDQILYGVVQGSVYKDLRTESAQEIVRLGFPAYCIGGVSVGESKKEMRSVLDWTIPYLEENKPRHLLGVGEIDDLFECIEKGIDTFDCVVPTRLARKGAIMQKNKAQSFKIDIIKHEYADQTSPLQEGCECYTCAHFSRAYVHHLFRAKELLALRLATIHNVYFTVNIVDKIRLAIEQGNLQTLKKDWLS